MKRLPAALMAAASALSLAASGAQASGIRGDYSLNWLTAEYLDIVRQDSTYTAGSVRQAKSVVQDLRLVYWPGLRGIDVQGHVRGRWGSNDLWPYGDRDPEVVNLFLSFTRDRYRLRAGRQTLHGALGVYYLDGGNLRVLPTTWLTVQAWGGWSRGRTLNQDRTESLLAEEDAWAPLESSTLWAGEVTLRPRRKPVSASLLYLREIRTDRSTLYSERLSVSAYATVGGWYVDALGTFDLASAQTNTLSLGGRRALFDHLDFFTRFRHYLPYFELWTIWGAFSPVAYEEMSWGADYHRGSWRASVSGAYRSYGNTNAGLETFPVEDDGWRAAGSLGWNDSRWEATLGGSITLNPGAYLGSTDAAVRYRASEQVTLGAHGTANQRINEYRLGDGRTFGGGLTLQWDRRPLSLRAQAGYYAQRQEELPNFGDYNQFRSRLVVTYRLGRDPGSSRTGRVEP